MPVIAGSYMRICASGAGISGAWIIKYTPWNTAWYNHFSLPWIDLFIARKFLIYIPYNRVYPNRCADGFNVLCLVVLYNDYKMASFHLLVYPYFPGLAGGVKCPRASEATLQGMGKRSCSKPKQHTTKLEPCAWCGTLQWRHMSVKASQIIATGLFVQNLVC